MKTLYILVIFLLLQSCKQEMTFKEPVKIVSKTSYGLGSVITVEHDGCLLIVSTNGGLIHHPRCTNHETKFR